jgi:hypothetical protein
MANTNQVRKEFKVYSVEASNSGTPDSFHLVAIASAEKFRSYADAENWIETKGEKTDYTILEIISKK